MTTFYCLTFNISQIWRARFPYLYPPGTGWSDYTPRHWVPLSSPPTTRRATVEVFDPASTRGSELPGWCPRYVNLLHGPWIKHNFQQFLYCWMRICCRGNVFTEPFSSVGRLLFLIKNVLPSSECYFVVCFEVATQKQLCTLQYVHCMRACGWVISWGTLL
jgi:hypothetical protein